MSEAITELFKRVILPEEGVGVSEESLIIIVYEYNNIQGDFLLTFEFSSAENSISSCDNITV